jgi:hypothetical protein
MVPFSTVPSEAAFEQWTTTTDFEAAHDELFRAMFLDPDYADRYESAETIEAPCRSVNRTSGVYVRHSERHCPSPHSEDQNRLFGVSMAVSDRRWRLFRSLH